MDFQHDVSDERPPKRQHIETSVIMEDFTSPSEALKMAEDTAVIEGTSTTVKGKGKRRRDRRATSYHKGDKRRENSARPAGPKAPRCPKRQCALLIGFCGSGYSGMQMYVTKLYGFECKLTCHSQSPPLKTIEGTLFRGLVEAGAVSEDNADDPVKVRYSHQLSGRSQEPRRLRWLVLHELMRVSMPPGILYP